MKLKDQVLTKTQVYELINLGFDVEKYATSVIITAIDNNHYIVDKKLIDMGFIKAEVIKYFPTLTIGDIMDILPERIEDIYNYDFQSAKLNGKFIVRYNDYKHEFKESYFIIEDKNQINALFETLKWCIENKHIAI